jgi:hypothetical protein
LVWDRGVSMAQAACDRDLNINVLRKKVGGRERANSHRTTSATYVLPF